MSHIGKILRKRSSRLSGPGWLMKLAGCLAGAARTAEWLLRVASQRRALRELDEHQLKDIGLSRADALREANRYWWDVPPRAAVEGRGAENGPRPQVDRQRAGAGLRAPTPC